MSAMFRSLRIFNYRLWFLGATVSNVGTWMQRTAQDWIVLTDLTDHDATAVGVSMALQFGPILLLTPLAGLVADMVDRRRLLLVTQVFMGLLSLTLGILYLAGVAELWMVFVFALFLGVASAFDGPVRQSFVSELVPRDYVSNAIGLNGTSFTLARLVGPATAGLLTLAVGAGWVFAINFLTFAATVAALGAMRRDELHLGPRPRWGERRMRDGMQYVVARDHLVVVIASAFVFGAIGMNFPIFIVTMATVEFGVGAGGFGVLSSVVAIGSVTGALLGARRERPTVRTIGVGALAFGVVAVASAVSPLIWIYGAFIVGLGIASVTVLNSSNAYLQLHTPLELRGRVMAIYMAVVMGSSVLGAPLIGWVADTFGPRWATAVGALGGFVPATIILGWWLWRWRAGRGDDAAPDMGPTAPTV